MKSKWKQMTAQEKRMIVVRLVLSAAIIAFAAMQIFGVLENAIDYAVPLLGVYMLILAAQEWKERRGSAILSLCAALFVLLCTIFVWFGKG